MSDTIEVTTGGDGLKISTTASGTYTFQRPLAKCPHGHVGELGTIRVVGDTERKYGPICWDCYGAWMAATFPTTEYTPDAAP